MGRGIEVACMNWLIERMFAKGYRNLYAQLIPNLRNKPMQNMFEEYLFLPIKDEKNLWMIDLLKLSNKDVNIPEYFDVNDNFNSTLI